MVYEKRCPDHIPDQPLTTSLTTWSTSLQPAQANSSVVVEPYSTFTWSGGLDFRKSGHQVASERRHAPCFVTGFGAPAPPLFEERAFVDRLVRTKLAAVLNKRRYWTAQLHQTSRCFLPRCRLHEATAFS